MPEGATGGTLTLNPNNSYIGEIEYTIENAHPANGLDKTIKTALYEKVMEKCRTLATDGKIYNNVSSKKEYVWNGTSYGMVFQYLYNSGYVTFSIGSYGKKFTVSPQFDQ
jgi:hypothetical protein